MRASAKALRGGLHITNADLAAWVSPKPKATRFKICFSINKSAVVGGGGWVGVNQVYYCNRPCMLLLSTPRGIPVVSDLLHTYLIREPHP